MELKLTTQRALEYENRTGKDILVFLQSVAEKQTIYIKDVVDLFLALGENYTIDDFEEWQAPYTEKVSAIMDAVNEFVQGKK